MEKKKIKSKLKTKREELGISQWDLGLMSGVNFRMIQFYEQGFKDINKAQVTTLNRLAESLGCEISDLIDTPKIKKEYLAIGKWSDNYNGAGIYSLVDQDGKRYIGQAIKIQNRLEQHRINLNSVLKDSKSMTSASMELCHAVESGKRFHVEILKKIDFTDDIKNELNYWEDYYFKKYGGIKETYNSHFTLEYDKEKKYYNEYEIKIKLSEKTDSDIIEYLTKQDTVNGYLKELIRKDIEEIYK